MLASLPPLFPQENQLLLELALEEYTLLAPHLERMRLVEGETLYEADDKIKYAYFLLSGMVSLLATTQDGRMIEVAQVGSEGVIGLPVVLGIHNIPYRAVVQIKASAMRIKAAALRSEFNRGGQLQGVLLNYMNTRLTQVSQAMICNHFHTVEQRLSRWLLMAQSRVHSNLLHFTQQHISEILGTSRTNIAMCAGVLQQKKFIQCTRGQITIVDQQGLEAYACDCSREMKDESGSFLAA